MALQTYFNSKKVRLAATLNSLISTISQLSVACQLQIDQQYLTAKNMFIKHAMKQNENIYNNNSVNTNMNTDLYINKDKMGGVANNLGQKFNRTAVQDQTRDECMRQYCEELRKQEANILKNIIKHLLEYFKSLYLIDNTSQSSNLQVHSPSLDIKPVTHNHQVLKQKQKQKQIKQTAQKQINRRQWMVVQQTPQKQVVFVGQGMAMGAGREGALIDTVRKRIADGSNDRDRQTCNGTQIVQQVNKQQIKHKQIKVYENMDQINKKEKSYIQLMPKKRYQSLTRLSVQSQQKLNRSPIRPNPQAELQPQPQPQLYAAPPQPQPQPTAPQPQPINSASALQQIPKTCQKLDNMIHEEAVELLKREKDRDRNRARARNQYNAKKFYESLDRSGRQGDSVQLSRGNSRINTINSASINQKVHTIKNNIVNINKINKTNPNSIVTLSSRDEVNKTQNRALNNITNPNQLIKQCLLDKQKLYRTNEAPSSIQPQTQPTTASMHLQVQHQLQNPKSIPVATSNNSSYQGYGNIDRFNQPIYINANHGNPHNIKQVRMVQFQEPHGSASGNVLRSKQRSQRMLVSQEKIREIQRDRDRQKYAYVNR